MSVKSKFKSLLVPAILKIYTSIRGTACEFFFKHLLTITDTEHRPKGYGTAGVCLYDRDMKDDTTTNQNTTTLSNGGVFEIGNMFVDTMLY